MAPPRGWAPGRKRLSLCLRDPLPGQNRGVTDTTNSPQRAHAILPTERAKAQARDRALAVSVVTTFFSLIPTAYAAWISNSIVLLADLIRCSIEFLAIFMSWAVARRISLGVATHYEFGAAKLERAASVMVGAAMMIAAATVIASAAWRLSDPRPVVGTLFGAALAVLSMIGNGALALWYRALHRKDASALLDSQARLFWAKLFAATIVVLGLIPAGVPELSEYMMYSDPIASMLLAVFLIGSAGGLVVPGIRELLDCSLDERRKLQILRVLIAHDREYLGLRSIRTRQVSNRAFVELALEFDGSETLEQVQGRVERISAAVVAELPAADVTVIPTPYRAVGD